MAERLVTVARFENEPQAALCRILLEREGIEAYLSEVNAIAAHWGLSNALGGVKVRVAEKDLEKALDVLQRSREAFETGHDPSLGQVSLVCEACGRTASFPGKARGTVQSCPRCREFLDVPQGAEGP